MFGQNPHAFVFFALLTVNEVFLAGVVVEQQPNDRILGVVIVQLSFQLGIPFPKLFPELIIDTGAIKIINVNNPVTYGGIGHNIRRDHIVAALGVARQEDVAGVTVLQVFRHKFLGFGTVIIIRQLEILVPSQRGAVGAPCGNDGGIAAVVYIHRHGRPLGTGIFCLHVVYVALTVTVRFCQRVQHLPLRLRKRNI